MQHQHSNPEVKMNRMYEDDRPINSSGTYNLSNAFLDEVEIQENYDEVDAADDQDWELLNSIIGRYNEIITDEIELKS